MSNTGVPNLPVSYLATSEVVYAPIEEQLFDHLDDTRANRPFSEDTTNLYSANLNPTEGKIIGPGLMLKVMAGDQVELGVESLLSSSANSSTIPIQSLVYSLVNALSGPMAALEGISQAAQQAILDVGTLTLSINELQQQNADTTHAMAFLNYLLFDETMQLLPEMSQVIQLSQSSAWQTTTTELFTIPQNGFLYVFSSNQSGISIRTDNLFVTHYTGALLEEFHYYPFGLVFEATKAPSLPTGSDYKYNHQFLEQNEFTDATGNLYGLNWYDFEFRTYDPQLGRWWQADPLMQHASSYLAMSNNPVLFTDPLGLWDGTGAQQGEFRYGDGAWYVFLGGKEGWMLAEDQNDDTYLSIVNYYREKNRYLNNFPAQPDNYVDWTKNFQFAIEQNGPGLELAAKVCEYTPELVLIEAEALALTGKVIYKGGGYLVKGKFGKEVAENLLPSSLGNSAKGVAGVYDLGTTLGKYVGQSKDIMGRVTSHFAKGGKLSAGELQNAVFHSMPGSTKLQREVYEQFLINKYGINNLLNVRNPMGGRMDLYNSMIDDVIKQFGLPR